MKNIQEYSQKDLLRLVGSQDQIYSVKRYMSEEGKGKGSSIYQVTTGGKLQYDVAIDRGAAAAYEKHLVLTEVKTFQDLELLRNNMFNI